MNALTRKLFRDLWKWRGQILAIGAIIGCGIGAYVAFASVSTSLRGSLDSYYRRDRFADVFDQLTRAPDLVRRTIARIPGVAVVQTRIVRDVSIDVPGRSQPATGRVISVPDERMPALNLLYVQAGRLVRGGVPGEVVVSRSFANGNHLKVGSTLGAALNGRWQRLTVVGIAISPEFVYEIPPTGQPYPDPEHFGILWMAQSQVGAAFDMRGAFNDVSLQLAGGANPNDVIASLDRILDRYGGFGAYDRTLQPSARLLSDSLTRLDESGVFVALLFLAVAAFLLNVMLVRFVGTQRDQIAVLKAFGYRNGAIAVHYLGFVAVIVVFGAFVGAALGIWWGHVFTNVYSSVFFHLPDLEFRTSPAVFGQSLLFCAAAAAVGALTAVRRAVMLAPAEAMRPEAPEAYRKTAFERFSTLVRAPLAMRIVSRNIEHKPLISALSVAGVALAIALLILARYVPDAVDSVFNNLFYQTDREDATVTFAHTLGAGSALDIAGLPGVTRVEPYLSVPARVAYGAASRRVAITGLMRGADLHRIVDASGRSVSVPPEGLLISRKLAQVLHVPVGAMLDVAVIEGRRRHVPVRVAGTVDVFFSTGLYCDIGTLGRIAGEPGQMSGAYVALDDRQTDAFDRAIKRVPSIAGVTFREAAMSSFSQTLAQDIRLDASMIFLFACVIALGVAYNTARIALSERAIELSSLRILGFTRAETWRILVGEQLFITTAAAAPGIVAGALFTRWLSVVRSTEEFSLPWTLTPASVAFALIFVLGVTAISSLVVRRQIDRLDIISVLKSGD